MEIGQTEIIIFSLAGFAIWCWIVFELIKAGVKAGILAADQARKPVAHVKQNVIPEADWTPRRLELKKKYEAGEITVDEYNSEWFKS